MTFPAIIELSDIVAGDGSDGFVVNGIDPGDESGWSVASAGDVNGDGIDDLIIGARNADPGGRTDAGETYVVFGRAGGFSAVLDLAALDGSNGFVINGIDISDFSGYSVAGAGDVNGDGIDDMIIGAYPADPGGRTEAGEAYVVFGNAGGFAAALELSALDGSNGFVINGIDAGDQSGWSVASAGDINGDGIDDLIIGAVSADPDVHNDAGESYVVFGSATGFSASLDLSTLDGGNGFVINGTDADDGTGYSVASAGDVNGDGVDDLIVGAYSADPGGQSFAGESYVVFGSADGFIAALELSALDGSNGFVINGIDAADLSGISVASAGDVNGDGIDDLIIGANGAGPGGRTEAGETYVVFGNAGGFAATLELSALDGSNGFTIAGIDANDQSGRSVAGAGDVNGDGYDDLIVGAYLADPGFDQAGETYIIYGRTSNQTEGTPGVDTLKGAGGDDELFGRDENDTLNGLDGNDALLGNDGNDALYGGGGNDRLRGGAGADDLYGGAGDDIYLGVTSIDVLNENPGEGTDTVKTRENNFVLPDNFENLILYGSAAMNGTGNAADNTIIGIGGHNFVLGLDGNDTIDGRWGNDTLDGGRGNDIVLGGLGDDILRGDLGDDMLSGGERRDTMFGGDGNDVLNGGAGRDELTGGIGADSFAFFDGDFGGVGYNSADRILDFNRAEGDLIDLSGVDADTDSPDDNAFTLIDGNVFSGTAGEIFYRHRDGFTFVYGDTDGDALADFAIRLDGTHDLVASDFVF